MLIWRRSMGLDDSRPWRSAELEMVRAKSAQDGGQTGHAEGALLARTPMTGMSSCPVIGIRLLPTGCSSPEHGIDMTTDDRRSWRRWLHVVAQTRAARCGAARPRSLPQWASPRLRGLGRRRSGGCDEGRLFLRARGNANNRYDRSGGRRCRPRHLRGYRLHSAPCSWTARHASSTEVLSRLDRWGV